MNPIFKRASVRKYKNQPVLPEQIELLMSAAMAAPSAKNSQPWEFLVIQDKETFKKIMDFHPYSSMLDEAALAIVVCADTQKESPDLKGLDFWTQDCAAATQNILLEATELGLGGVWLGVYPRENLVSSTKELFSLPENIVPFSIVSIGYPEGEVYPKNKFDSNKIHWEKW